MNYRPDIDGLRAVAVLSVVINHAFPLLLPGGFVGVDIFFVISGYLISTIVLDAIDEDRFSIADFYARRARRILPALIVVLVAVLAVGWFIQTAVQYAALARTAAAATLFVANMSLWQDASYFAWTSKSAVLLHLWSLSVEEQFYVFWPLILVALKAWPRLTLPGAVAIVAASFLYSVDVAQVDQSRAFYWLPSRMWELGAGGILALLRLRGDSLPAPVALASAAAGFALVVVSVFLLDGSMFFPGFVAIAPTRVSSGCGSTATGVSWAVLGSNSANTVRDLRGALKPSTDKSVCEISMMTATQRCGVSWTNPTPAPMVLSGCW